VITLTTLATGYFQEIEAPTKELALIPDAGHFAAFTQPQRFLTELRTRVHPLASATSPSSTRRG
jgi:pimeloyl-ACP methyl ester carboxylesterase